MKRIEMIRERISRKIRRLKFIKLDYEYKIKSILASSNYININELQLRETRKSDTVFIFGSGYSLNEVTDYEWDFISKHDTIGFNYFFHQNFVDVRYHLIKEGSRNDLDKEISEKDNKYYMDHVNSNPRYKNTIFIIQKALNGNRFLGNKLLKKNARIFRYKTHSRKIYHPPTTNFEQGLVHGPGTLMDCINFAAIMNWGKIVLAGVDLYDRRYFWLSENETRDTDLLRNANCAWQHQTADPTVDYLSKWRDELKKRGVELYVMNPKSLLSRVMPVFEFDDLVYEMKLSGDMR